MNFLAPGAFLLGLLLPVIVALYLLKLRRVERPVPSNYLWRRMVRDVEANAPWQKLKPNLLMILQLLFLLAMIFALARPFNWSEGASGQAAVIIIDNSASMSATDTAPTRLDAAKQRARQLVDDMPDNARVTVIEAGREARVLVSSSLDRRQAYLAIESVRAGTGGAELAVALELASAIAARQPGAEIIVLSDGRVTLPERLSLRGVLRYLPFGTSGENQAVSLLTLEQNTINGSLTAFVQVSNYGTEAASRRVTLYADGMQVYANDLADIPPGGQQNVIAEGLPPETRQIEARLDAPGNAVDILPLDDRAMAIAQEVEPLTVRVVTYGNRFIRTVFGAMGNTVTVVEETVELPDLEEPVEGAPTPTPRPTAAVVQEEDDREVGLTIFDNYVPDTLPASGSLLFIAPSRSTEYFTTTGYIELPTPRIIDPTDPLVTNVSLDTVGVASAVQIPLPQWATPVVAGELDEGNVPLLFRGEVDGRRIAVLAFDLRRSDLPLQVAFPLLWNNLIDWLAPGSRNAIPATVLAGESISFGAPEGAPNATVTLPDGSTETLTNELGRFVFANTTQLGVYTVRAGEDFQADFAVNLFSPQESTLLPADNLPGLSSEQGEDGRLPQQAMREWWRPLALLALGLLAGEWLVYHRAALTRLRDLFKQPPAAPGRTGSARKLSNPKR